MWLLDHNIPRQIVNSLDTLGIPCDTALNRGWSQLKNGELLSAAVEARFVCILTRDTLFSESATKNIKKFPNMSLVLLTLPQRKGEEYAKEFIRYWEKSPIVLGTKQVIRWP